MPTVSAANARVHYSIDGSGPGLILVHGTGAGAEFTFGHLKDRFTDRYTLIMPDLSGSAQAEDDGGPLTVEQLAQQVAATIEHAGDEPVDVVGFSLGSLVSAVLAATRPELVKRLVLAAGWSVPDEYIQDMMTVWLRLASDPDAFGRYATMTAFSPSFLNQLGRDQIEQIVPGMQPTPATLRQIELNLRADIRPYLPRVQAETLVIGCTRDGTIPVENARQLHAALPGSTYAEFDTGHAAVVEQADEFVTSIREFLAR